MNREGLRNLTVGDRVEHRTLAGNIGGTVSQKYRTVVVIRWDDGGGVWILNWRARFDRQRAQYVVKLPPLPEPDRDVFPAARESGADF